MLKSTSNSESLAGMAARIEATNPPKSQFTTGSSAVFSTSAAPSIKTDPSYTSTHCAVGAVGKQ